MEKCTSCGAVYTEAEMFCSQCGAQINSEAPNAVTAMLLEAQKAFDNDAKVSVDRNKITYVCELCASINLIDEPNCTKCGKPRPRAEFVKALRDLRDGKAAKDELQEANELKAQEALEAQEAQEPTEAQEPNSGLQLFKYEGEGSFIQPPAVRQPFVIVPYVDTNQKLYQYQPRQAYRFVPYTQEELAEQAAQRQQDEAASLLEMKAMMQQSENAAYEAEKCYGFKKSLVVRAIGVKNAIVGIATIVVMFLFAMFSGDASYKGIELFKSITDAFSGADWTAIIAPAGSIVIALLSLIIVGVGIKKAITGRICCGYGWILNAVTLLIAIAMGVLFIVGGVCEFSGLGLGYILIVALTAVSTLIAAFTPKK